MESHPLRTGKFYNRQAGVAQSGSLSWSTTITMTSIKRQASDSFSEPQALVKRQKSSSDLLNSQALTVGAKDQNGALVSSVRVADPAIEVEG